MGVIDPSAEPDRVRITYAPSKATYEIEYEGLRCVTEIFVPAEGPSVCQRVTLTNLRDDPLELSATPVLRHACRWGSAAAWDKPEWYTKTAFFRDPAGPLGFSTLVTSPTCDISKRRSAVFWSSPEDVVGAEFSYDKFVGDGSFENPAAVFSGQLEVPLEDAGEWGEYGPKNHLFAYPQICALQYAYRLVPGETKSFRQSFSWIPNSEEGLLPDLDRARVEARLLEHEAMDAELEKLAAKFDCYTEARSIETPDTALNQYVNEWLPLQLDWVCSLDRGWPTGMRGGRDAANDFAALAPYDPAFTRELILTELSCQRDDGFVPRHFSAQGHAGPERDRRYPIDAGAVVVEMVHSYLGYTQDFSLFDEWLPWLDEPAERQEPFVVHLTRILDFYLDPENIGEHGLVKIREGGWLDSLNQAGVKGRGEGVMVTCQVVYALELVSEIVRKLKALNRVEPAVAEGLLNRYAEAKSVFKDSLLKHALNEEGYFNGFFNDDGHWLFSPKDPDGERRVYGPASYWAIISGVAVPEHLDACLQVVDFLRCEAGYQLNWPGFTKKRIPNVGRQASGDSPSGRSEHANPYNHGSHGFLGRAMSVAGKGDLLYDALKSLLPYDQEKHPVGDSRTPPYGVVNVWENIPRFKNRGKDVFLTGSTAYGLRMAYEWMLGIRPSMNGLVIDPCLPCSFDRTEVFVEYLGKPIRIEILNAQGREAGLKSLALNGFPVASQTVDPFSGRRVFVIAPSDLKEDANAVVAEL